MNFWTNSTLKSIKWIKKKEKDIFLSIWKTVSNPSWPSDRKISVVFKCVFQKLQPYKLVYLSFFQEGQQDLEFKLELGENTH